jgi:hypothetical protein
MEKTQQQRNLHVDDVFSNIRRALRIGGCLLIPPAFCAMLVRDFARELLFEIVALMAVSSRVIGTQKAKRARSHGDGSVGGTGGQYRQGYRSGGSGVVRSI